MIIYNPDILEHILVKGDNKNAFPMDESLSISYITYRVKELANDKIESFLDFQYQKSDYKNAMLSIVFYHVLNSNKLPDKTKRTIAKEWIEKVLPIDISIVHVLFDRFLKYKTVEFESEPIIKLLEYKESNDIVHIMEFCLKLANEGIKLHRYNCNEACFKETQYVKRIDFCKMIIVKHKPELESVSIDKIQWKGTQKQLGELFVQLKRKGWIDDFEYKTIKACFTKTNSIQQILKPYKDTSTGNDDYDGIFTPQYDSIFSELPENKNDSK